jgi:hypothetical protein
MASASPSVTLLSASFRRELEATAWAVLRARRPHPTKIKLVEAHVDVEFRDGTRIRVSESAWC